MFAAVKIFDNKVFKQLPSGLVPKKVPIHLPSGNIVYGIRYVRSDSYSDEIADDKEFFISFEDMYEEISSKDILHAMDYINKIEGLLPLINTNEIERIKIDLLDNNDEEGMDSVDFIQRTFDDLYYDIKTIKTTYNRMIKLVEGEENELRLILLERLRSRINFLNRYIFVVDQGEIKSLAEISYRDIRVDKTHYDHNMFHIDSVVTSLKEYKKTGSNYGTKMMMYIMKKFIESDSNIAYTTPLNDHVMKYYRKFGFTNTEESIDLFISKDVAKESYNKLARFFRMPLVKQGTLDTDEQWIKELLSLEQEYGILAGSFNANSIMIQKEDILYSVKSIILRDDKKFLILKDAYSDWWDLPGGHRDETETSIEALKREIKEETNLSVIDQRELFTEKLQLGKDPPKPVKFFLVIAKGGIELSEEHLDFKWVSYQESFKYNLGVFHQIIKKFFRDFNVIKQEYGILVDRNYLSKQIINQKIADRPGLVQREVLVHPQGREPYKRRQWVKVDTVEDKDLIRSLEIFDNLDEETYKIMDLIDDMWSSLIIDPSESYSSSRKNLHNIFQITNNVLGVLDEYPLLNIHLKDYVYLQLSKVLSNIQNLPYIEYADIDHPLYNDFKNDVIKKTTDNDVLYYAILMESSIDIAKIAVDRYIYLNLDNVDNLVNLYNNLPVYDEKNKVRRLVSSYTRTNIATYIPIAGLNNLSLEVSNEHLRKSISKRKDIHNTFIYPELITYFQKYFSMPDKLSQRLEQEIAYLSDMEISDPSENFVKIIEELYKETPYGLIHKKIRDDWELSSSNLLSGLLKDSISRQFNTPIIFHADSIDIDHIQNKINEVYDAYSHLGFTREFVDSYVITNKRLSKNIYGHVYPKMPSLDVYRGTTSDEVREITEELSKSPDPNNNRLYDAIKKISDIAEKYNIKDMNDIPLQFRGDLYNFSSVEIEYALQMLKYHPKFRENLIAEYQENINYQRNLYLERYGMKGLKGVILHNPVSSWSLDDSIAEDFARRNKEGGIVLKKTLSPEDMWSFFPMHSIKGNERECLVINNLNNETEIVNIVG